MILPRVGLSEKRKIPYFNWLGYAMHPWNLPRVLVKSMGWRIHKKGGEIYVEKGEIKAVMDIHHIRVLVNEWDSYVKDYLPLPDFKPRRILDVGCGQGETMVFFDAMTGCKDYIGVDLGDRTRHYLELNSILNDWDVEIYNEPLSPSHLVNDYDFVKIDVEGAESCLTDHEFNVPTVMEVHSKDLTKQFQGKGFQTTRIVNKSRDVVIMNNFNHLRFVGEMKVPIECVQGSVAEQLLVAP